MSLIAKAVTRILSDIEPFSRHVLNRPLRPYQLAPARAILDSILHQRGDTFAVVMARQAGKNETAQIEAYLLNLFQRAGGSIVKASPTFKPQTVNSMLRLGQHLNNAWNTGYWRKSHGYILQLGDARAFFFSAHGDTNVVGATASLLLECDEAQDVDPAKWSKDFVPMSASTNATRVFWGTVWTSKTLLASQMRHRKRLQAQDGRQRLFTYDAHQVAAHVPAYGQHVANQVANLDRHHPLIRTQYFLEEIDAEAGLFPAQRQALMRGQHQRNHDPRPLHTYAILIDVAGEEEDAPPLGAARVQSTRRDATALTVVHIDDTLSDLLSNRPTYFVQARRLWIGAKHASLYAALSAIIDHWNARHIVIDATGAGAGLASFLQARFGERVHPVTFTSRTKTDIGWQFIAIIEAGRYKEYSNDQESDTRQFWYEVEACDYESPAPDRLRWGVWETPTYDGLIARGHDDLLVSAAMTAVLDTLTSGPADSTVVPASDSLRAYDAGYWWCLSPRPSTSPLTCTSVPPHMHTPCFACR